MFSFVNAKLIIFSIVNFNVIFKYFKFWDTILVPTPPPRLCCPILSTILTIGGSVGLGRTILPPGLNFQLNWQLEGKQRFLFSLFVIVFSAFFIFYISTLQ